METEHRQHHSERDKQALIRDLKKIEGQVRGVQKMIEEERYCVDILVQLSAVKSATQRIALKLLEGHTHGCVANALQTGEGETHVRELMEVIRLMTNISG